MAKNYAFLEVENEGLIKEVKEELAAVLEKHGFATKNLIIISGETGEDPKPGFCVLQNEPAKLKEGLQFGSMASQLVAKFVFRMYAEGQGQCDCDKCKAARSMEDAIKMGAKPAAEA